jgi:hypothetical protein
LIRLYNYKAYRIFRLQLKRGYIILIAGGAMVAISILMLAYYGLQFVNSIEQEETITVGPGSSIELQQNINARLGAYVVAFQDFRGQAAVKITDPSGRPVVEKSISPPLVMELFEVGEPGVHTLVLSNPTDVVLEAAVVLGDSETVLEMTQLTSAVLALAFTSLLVIGIAVAIAGAVITILDRRRSNKMKQFGDTSDLV